MSYRALVACSLSLFAFLGPQKVERYRSSSLLNFPINIIHLFEHSQIVREFFARNDLDCHPENMCLNGSIVPSTPQASMCLLISLNNVGIAVDYFIICCQTVSRLQLHEL